MARHQADVASHGAGATATGQPAQISAAAAALLFAIETLSTRQRANAKKDVEANTLGRNDLDTVTGDPAEGTSYEDNRAGGRGHCGGGTDGGADEDMDLPDTAEDEAAAFFAASFCVDDEYDWAAVQQS